MKKIKESIATIIIAISLPVIILLFILFVILRLPFIKINHAAINRYANYKGRDENTKLALLWDVWARQKNRAYTDYWWEKHNPKDEIDGG